MQSIKYSTCEPSRVETAPAPSTASPPSHCPRLFYRVSASPTCTSVSSTASPALPLRPCPSAASSSLLPHLRFSHYTSRSSTASLLFCCISVSSTASPASPTAPPALLLHPRLFHCISASPALYQGTTSVVPTNRHCRQGLQPLAVFRSWPFHTCSIVKRSERNCESLSRGPDGLGRLRCILERLYTPRQPPGIHGIWSGSISAGACHLAPYAQARSAPRVIGHPGLLLPCASPRTPE